MKKNQALKKLIFKLDPNDWHGCSEEAVWVTALGGSHYKLENTPFFAQNVSYMDELIARNDNGTLVFTGIHARSGHSTYRILVEGSTAPTEFSKQWKKLEELGCTCEDIDADPPLFAVDVPADADIHRAYDILEEGEGLGIWSFEEGHCGHEV